MNIDEDVKFLKIQTCVLKVNIHCDGCKQKVKKLLQKIDGVYTTTVDSEQGKVTVSGNVDASTLIKKLGKSGKHAELWSSPKGGNKNSSNPLDMLLQKMGQKGQKDAKSEKGGKDQKGLPQLQLPQQLQQMKRFQDMKLPQFKNLQLPPKDQKSVKFKAVEDDLSDEYDDDDDDFDDEFDDEFDEEEEEMMKAQLLKDIKMKAMNGLQVPSAGNKNVQLPVKGDGGKKGGANPTPNLNQNQNSGGGGKGGAKNGGANDKNTPKGGGPPKEMGPMGPGLQKLDLSGFGVGAGQMGQMGHQMGQIPRQSMPPQGNIPAVHGLPMNAGGYFPPAGPEIRAGNPYHQQQLAAMMYARPPPDVAYALYTPPPQYHSSGPETDFFSEENTNSCSVM